MHNRRERKILRIVIKYNFHILRFYELSKSFPFSVVENILSSSITGIYLTSIEHNCFLHLDSTISFNVKKEVVDCRQQATSKSIVQQVVSLNFHFPPRVRVCSNFPSRITRTAISHPFRPFGFNFQSWLHFWLRSALTLWARQEIERKIVVSPETGVHSPRHGIENPARKLDEKELEERQFLSLSRWSSCRIKFFAAIAALLWDRTEFHAIRHQRRDIFQWLKVSPYCLQFPVSCRLYANVASLPLPRQREMYNIFPRGRC